MPLVIIMEQGQSSAQYPAKRVRECAMRALNGIKESRDKEWSEHVDRYVGRRKHWLTRKRWTRDEAEKLVDREAPEFEILFGEQESVCRRIIQLCDADPSGLITVTAADARAIWLG